MDAAHHYAGAVPVEERDRGALLAADVAKGVIVQHGAAGEGVVEFGLVHLDASLESFDRDAQIAHLFGEVFGVRDDVALAVNPKNGLLGATQTPDAQPKNDGHDDQDDVDRGRAERDVGSDVCEALQPGGYSNCKMTP